MLGEEEDVERLGVDDHPLAVKVPVRPGNLDGFDVVRVDLNVFEEDHRLGELVDLEIVPVMIGNGLNFVFGLVRSN